MTDPLALVLSSELVRLLIAKEVVVALVKRFDPEKVLLSERSEEDAALIVMVPPKETGEPLMVSDPPFTRSPFPMVVVAVTLPFASVVRSELVILVK